MMLLNVKNSEKIVRWIDYTIIVILCVFCVKYMTYEGRFFAEKSFQFSFLNFPVFVGEFLLAGLLIFFIVRAFFAKIVLEQWHLVFCLFVTFIVLKALWGYMHWGPLALRDAALFYYVLFGWLSFVCFRLSLFNKWMVLILYAALMWLYFNVKFNEYWMMPRIYLGIVLAMLYEDRRVGVLMALGIIICTPFELFINTSRSVMLGNFLSVVLLLVTWPFFVAPAKRMKYFFVSLLALMIFAAYIFHFSGSRPAQGLLAIDKLKLFLNETQQEIDSKKPTFKKREQVETVMIFSPNEEVPDKPVVVAVQPVAPAEPIPQPVSQVQVKKREVDSKESTEGMKLGNSIFRILLWKDAWMQIAESKEMFGIDFGKPFRSKNLEIIRSAVDEWKRDGWIAMHNSYLNILYRGGIVGAIFMITLISLYIYMVKVFISHQSLVGLLMCASLIVPFVAAFFAVTLELPYTAVPIWTLFGMTLAVARLTKAREFKTSS